MPFQNGVPTLSVKLCYLDLCSSILSFLAFLLSSIIAIVSASRNRTFMFDTWNENLLVIPDNNYTFRSQVSVWDHELSKKCVDSGDAHRYDLFYREQTWNPTTNYTVVSLSTQGESFEPLPLLIFVLFVSSFFQFFRYYFSGEGSDIAGFRLQYLPESGPDVWRWIEYALTSPLQIILISAVFNARENNLMILLASLQFALVMFGYSMEILLQDIIQVSDYPKNTKRSDAQTIFVFFFYLCASWVFHGLIWGILISKFSSSSESAADCRDDPSNLLMPDAVWIVFISQIIAFTSFGATLTLQSVYIFFNRDFLRTEENVGKMWKTVTYSYSILSVTAKLFLEYGLLMALGWEALWG